jgi:hypothetical protein
MRQIAYPAALGSCVLGGGASPLWAAEWSISPIYSASVDYDNNRRLEVWGGKGTDAAVVAIDVTFKRALEDLEFTIEPRYAFRRYTDPSLGNGDDRTLNAGMIWARELSVLNLTASYWDQSTLITEELETGRVSGDTHRRNAQAGANWTWNQTERRSLLVQLNYADVSYYGQAAELFPGYRNSSGTLGERFAFSERGSFTVSAYGSIFSSSIAGNNSHLLGLQGEVIYAFSEKNNVDVSLGESKRVISGESSNGTDVSASANHSFFRDKISLVYTRSLVPYGSGFLVQRQQYTATLTHPWNEYLDTNLSFVRVQNNETAVLLRIDRRSYESLSASLNWRPTETWSVDARLEGVHSVLADIAGDTANSWRSSITLTWRPLPKTRSW